MLLYRDPRNEFDRWAVRAVIDGVHVGWLSKSDARIYGRVMDEAGLPRVEATLLSVTERYPRITFDLPARVTESVRDLVVQEDFD